MLRFYQSLAVPPLCLAMPPLGLTVPPLSLTVPPVCLTVPPLMCAPQGEFAWDKPFQGLLLSSYFYGYTAGLAPGGWVADK